MRMTGYGKYCVVWLTVEISDDIIGVRKSETLGGLISSEGKFIMKGCKYVLFEMWFKE